jgi:hypothetical protein
VTEKQAVGTDRMQAVFSRQPWSVMDYAGFSYISMTIGINAVLFMKNGENCSSGGDLKYSPGRVPPRSILTLRAPEI